MHAITILQRCLSPLLKQRTRATLGDTAGGCGLLRKRSGIVADRRGPPLRGRGVAPSQDQARRPAAGQWGRLQQEARSIYAALCRVTLARIGEPVILIDWSDLKADQSLHLLRASLPVGGRALTLYEEAHPQKKLGNRAVQHRFLQQDGSVMSYFPGYEKSHEGEMRTYFRSLPEDHRRRYAAVEAQKIGCRHQEEGDAWHSASSRTVL